MKGSALFFPLWQGSSGENTLYKSARKLCSVLDDVGFDEVPVVKREKLRSTNGIVGYESILKHQSRMRQELDTRRPERIATLGGGCDADMLPMTELNRLYGGDMAVLWLDAHADLNTPESSPSGLFHGMPMRTALGEGDKALISLCGSSLRSGQVVYAGIRDMDPPEETYIREHDVIRLDRSTLRADPRSLSDALRKTGCRHLYVHLDLDVLEPENVPGLLVPCEAGLSVEEVEDLLVSASDTLDVVGFALTEYVYRDTGDLELASRLFRLGMSVL